HPATVHFPIALLVLSLGCYGVYLFREEKFYQRGAFGLHLIGVVGMAVAVLTGNQAQGDLSDEVVLQELVQQHQISGFVLLWLFGMLLIWRYLRLKRMARWEQWLFLGLFAAANGLMFYSAHLGGKMVYEHGAGVLL
ncbi:MAG: DUF2231 domain-containing protein, partial [Bacteroidota bacterium]